MGAFCLINTIKKHIISGERLEKIEDCEMENFDLFFFLYFLFSLAFPIFSFSHYARRFPLGKRQGHATAISIHKKYGDFQLD